MRANVFGIDFAALDQSALIREVLNRVRTKVPSYIVPTNLHLVVRHQRDAELRSALADTAAMVVPDGRPLLWMAWLRGTPMQLVTGSDLVVPLCREVARQQRSIFLF